MPCKIYPLPLSPTQAKSPTTLKITDDRFFDLHQRIYQIVKERQSITSEEHESLVKWLHAFRNQSSKHAKEINIMLDVMHQLPKAT
ncbi:MAG: hypothetical protein HW387_717 [Parachlamydiales bacterium]|nr:hypothetical protein [Parachlamydiales bacterium]